MNETTTTPAETISPENEPVNVGLTTPEQVKLWAKEATAYYYQHIAKLRKSIANNVQTHQLLKENGFEVPDLDRYNATHLTVTVEREDLPRLRQVLGGKLRATGEKVVKSRDDRTVWVYLDCPSRPGVKFKFEATLPENGPCQIQTVVHNSYTSTEVTCKIRGS